MLIHNGSVLRFLPLGRRGDEFRDGVQSVFPCTRSPGSRGERYDRYVQEASVRLLLTSGGVTNPSIRDALVDLLDKPIADSSALRIPTAEYGHPMCTPASCRDPRRLPHIT